MPLHSSLGSAKLCFKKKRDQPKATQLVVTCLPAQLKVTSSFGFGSPTQNLPPSLYSLLCSSYTENQHNCWKRGNRRKRAPERSYLLWMDSRRLAYEMCSFIFALLVFSRGAEGESATYISIPTNRVNAY